MHSFFSMMQCLIQSKMYFPLLSLLIGIAVGEVWTGSKLGTKQYNQELEAIGYGLEDWTVITERQRRWEPHPLLCVTFTSSSINTNVLSDNIKLMGDSCDWAVVFYNDNEEEIAQRCSQLSNLIHCRMFPMEKRVNSTSYANGNMPQSIPKTVLYTELLPYLSFYKRVFLMDEDISLIGFNISTFTAVWNCAFGLTPPLIVQPLIAESNQYIPYVNARAWQKRNIVASEVGLVEQQVPLFDAIFFEWFVRRVLSQTYSLALKYGVDWGHDRSWCNAAKLYSTRVLGRGNSTVVCAVLVKGTMVHHLNGHTMDGKRVNRANFHRNGVHVVQHYINLFPTWVLTDVVARTNPLVPRYEKNYKKVTSVSQWCMNNSM